MKAEMKERLLLRMFSNLEYNEKFVRHYVDSMDAAEEGMAQYKAHPPTDLKTQVELKGTISMWEDRALPNFRRMRGGAIKAFQDAQNGDFSTIRSCAGNLRGFGKDMDGISDDWWPYVDKAIREKYFLNLKAAMTTGNNIYLTLSDYWDPGQPLKEAITGPIDERELLKYLKPGESV